MPRTPTEAYLTGRKVRVEGNTYRDDEGNVHPDVYLVVGPHPRWPGVLRLQDVVDGEFTSASIHFVHPIT